MADMESICARLCLLTRAVWREELPSPLSRADVSRMIRFGALNGLTLRCVPEIKGTIYERARALLSRASAMYDEVERCRADGYTVILPSDDDWPKKLSVLGKHTPQYLFVRGNRQLFSAPSVAVAGSRKIKNETARMARSVGCSIAKEGYTLVSGGAPGVDTAAQNACLENGGSLMLVPAYPCSELLRQTYLNRALEQQKLLIICDTWPEEQFSAQKALSRNHTIYALGDAVIALAARKGVGGTWRGAVDGLRGRYAPVFTVNECGSDYAGSRALLSLGARQLDLSQTLGAQLFEKEAAQ